MNKVVLRSHYLLETCHLVCSALMCMYISRMCFMVILCIMYLTLKLFRENFFKDAGEVVDVRLAVDDDGRFKGYGHVEFATPDQAQNVSFC